ncbi:MAG: hypothetical protein IJJ40_02420 [Clostridia bacterium]|nr:hypothetical protein [Clostridia bacterium]
MNNIKYYNDSLAYDFNMFMPRESAVAVDTPAVRRNNVVSMPETQRVRKTKAVKKSVSISAFAVMLGVIVLAAFCGNIFLRIKVNEVNSKINDLKSEIQVLETERTSLKVELERRISFSNIEVEASSIGMQKLDKDQVKYIRVNEKNTAVTKDGEIMSSSQSE